MQLTNCKKKEATGFNEKVPEAKNKADRIVLAKELRTHFFPLMIYQYEIQSIDQSGNSLETTNITNSKFHLQSHLMLPR